MHIHIPYVMHECLNSGAEQLPGDACGSKGDHQILLFQLSPHYQTGLQTGGLPAQEQRGTPPAAGCFAHRGG